MPARIDSRSILCNNNGEWWVDWLYNKVMIIGPSADIKALDKLCIATRTVAGKRTGKKYLAFNRLMPTPVGMRGYDRSAWRNDNWGSDREPWNVVTELSPDLWTLSFSFESGGGFPLPIFEHLALNVPRLSFYCFSIESSGWYMEYGWLNTPAGCHDFHEVDLDEDPEPYTTDGVVRDAVSELRHQAAIANLKAIAKNLDSPLL